MNLDAKLLAKGIARFPDASRTDLDLHRVRNLFLHHLAAEAASVLRRDGTLPAYHSGSLTDLR